MNAHDLVFEYVLGALDADELDAFERELEKSPDLVAEVAAANDSLTTLAEDLPAATPSPDVRDRLMKTVAGSDRFLPFAADIAKYADLTVERVRELFKKIDEAWEAGPFPGIELIHFDGGPAAVGSDTGFVKFVAGFQFPNHSHHGDEVNYVMSGAVIDSDGTRYGPGDALLKTVDDTHAFSIPEDSETIIFVAQSGFDIIPPE